MLSLFISQGINFKTRYKAPQKATQDGAQSSTPIARLSGHIPVVAASSRFPSPGITYLNNLPELKPFLGVWFWENSG